jgi:hypothetical protein
VATNVAVTESSLDSRSLSGSPCSRIPRPCRHELALSPPRTPRYIPYIKLSTEESRLWIYFSDFIAPRCVLIESVNPFLDMILRLAATYTTGSLFHCVMAVSIRQMQILGHGDPQLSLWSYRNQALAILRKEIVGYESGSEGTSASKERIHQILLSTVMMCFFEVSSGPTVVHHTHGPHTLFTGFARLLAVMGDTCRLCSIILDLSSKHVS